MMKRTGVPRLGPDEMVPLPPQNTAVLQQQAGVSGMHSLAAVAQPQGILGGPQQLSAAGASFGRPRQHHQQPPPPPQQQPVINYLKPAPLLFQAKPTTVMAMPPRHKPPTAASPPPAPPPAAQFQRLKVEDALSYLDQVKYKFNAQPQVYNDFLDIMKEFKSQTIDTPGVITRVSNLFKGHPELIVGFNTFLPPGYKIEVQSNGQVSVSMPSPTALGAGALLGVHHAPQPPLVHLLPQPVGGAIVHNLSASPAPANTLHHISQAHQQLEAAAIHHQQQGGGPAAAGAALASAPPGQPVEFNHAIEYVNKIKSRFSRQPDKYKRFLEILHAYQRGHRDVKPQAKQHTEQEVYSQVAQLFENQDDLLAEFGQFLPDAKAGLAPRAAPAPPPPREEPARPASVAPPSPPPVAHAPVNPPKHATPAAPQHHLKRSPSFSSAAPISSGAPPPKKARAAAWAAASGGGGGGGVAAPRDVSLAEAARHAAHHEFGYFDRVRSALKSQTVYDNFLRCLLLFTNEIISSSELVCVTAPFLARHPELQRWLRDFVSPQSPPASPGDCSRFSYQSASLLGLEAREKGSSERGGGGAARYEPVGPLAAQLRHDRPAGDAAMDVDLSTCKRLGTSYCALPRGSGEAASRKCSGRTPLCKEVLNDTWVSFPTWSEDSTFVTSRKTQYEEYIYRCEDERFELDVVIETNAATIRVLEGVQKKLSRLSPAESAKYRLDDCLGGHSPTIQQRAIRRIYGEKAVDIIAGLKKNPAVAVPVVLRRLKAKEEEWREAQKGFNKQWREQNEKYYLKSLDHQGINFKQNDLKALRSKSLFNEVESAYSARRPGPHVCVNYNMKSRQEAIKITRDAAELLIHHARRQTAIQKTEKRRIKLLLRHFVPDLLQHPRQPLSDDEKDEEDKEGPASAGSASGDEASPPLAAALKQEGHEASSESDNASDKGLKSIKNKENTPKNNNIDKDAANAIKRCDSFDSLKEPKPETDVEDDYRDHPPNESRFVCTSSWYLFLRLHGVLCQRLAGVRHAAQQLQQQYLKDNRSRTVSVATALRLKPNNLPAEATTPADYYPALLELVRAALDGNVDAAAYEDALREMLGIRAYPAYTLDKLVSAAVRQLQHCVSEPWSRACAELRAAARRGGAQYVRRARRLLAPAHTAFLVRAFTGDECRTTFELLEGASGAASPEDATLDAKHNHKQQPRTNGEAALLSRSWAQYGERYARPDAHDARDARPDARPDAHGKPLFLARNARRGGRGDAEPRSVRVPAGAGGGAGGGGAGGAGRRRKPLLVDQQECLLSNTLRLIASRPHHLYRRGCLRAARDSHPRLHAARRARLRALLRRRADS